jgi:hypothetical protein
MPTVTVKVTALIPTGDYGNLGFELTQEIELPAEVPNEKIMPGALTVLRLNLALSVLPLVEAEVVRASSVLMKDANPDAFMRRNCKVYNWFVISNPDVRIPAMERILEEKEAERKPDIRRNIPVGTGGMEDQLDTEVTEQNQKEERKHWGG